MKERTESEPRLVYVIDGNLYVNVTQACTADCVFCPRHDDPTIAGQSLAMNEKVSPARYVEATRAALEDQPAATELVFCGFGEPTIRMDVIEAVARAVRDDLPRVRINTNGHGTLLNRRPILPGLRGLVDSFSVSLNAGSEEVYERLMRPRLSGAFGATVAFIEEALREGFDVTATVVDTLSDQELDQVRALAKSLDVPLRVRPFKDTW